MRNSRSLRKSKSKKITIKEKKVTYDIEKIKTICNWPQLNELILKKTKGYHFYILNTKTIPILSNSESIIENVMSYLGRKPLYKESVYPLRIENGLEVCEVWIPKREYGILKNIDTSFFEYGESQVHHTDGDGGVIRHAQGYYVYMWDKDVNGYRVTLNSKFRDAVNRDEGSFTDDNGGTWRSGDPLPNPGCTYKGKPVKSIAYLFCDCTQMTTMDVSKWNVDNVIDISYLFCNCINLETINLGGWDTSQVIDMRGTFLCCKNLKEIKGICYLNTAKVVDMSYLFSKCNSLIHLDLNSWNTRSVQCMSSLFYDCTALTNLNINQWDIGNVKHLSYVFTGCQSLTSLDLENWNTNNVTVMSKLFQNCMKLTTLKISKWDTKNVMNMYCLFCGCDSLKALDLSHWNTENVNVTYGIFYHCSHLSTVYVRAEFDKKMFMSSYCFPFNCNVVIADRS